MTSPEKSRAVASRRAYRATTNESQLDVAEHYNVSPLTIRTLLVNNGCLEKQDLNEELEAA